MSHIYTMEYYSAIKRNEIELFVVRWMDLDSIIQSEVRQKEKKQIPYANIYIWNVKYIHIYISEEPRGGTGIKMQT